MYLMSVGKACSHCDEMEREEASRKTEKERKITQPQAAAFFDAA